MGTDSLGSDCLVVESQRARERYLGDVREEPAAQFRLSLPPVIYTFTPTIVAEPGPFQLTVLDLSSVLELPYLSELPPDCYVNSQQSVVSVELEQIFCADWTSPAST